jgi:hypothetical protein
MENAWVRIYFTIKAVTLYVIMFNEWQIYFVQFILSKHLWKTLQSFLPMICLSCTVQFYTSVLNFAAEFTGLNPRQYTCNDTRRAINFDKYYTCECPTSWEGPYCEQDVDECARGFCEAWKVCDNKIGSYDCYCKATDIICKLSLEVWEFAVIVTAVILIILIVCVVFIVRKFK